MQKIYWYFYNGIYYLQHKEFQVFVKWRQQSLRFLKCRNILRFFKMRTVCSESKLGVPRAHIIRKSCFDCLKINTFLFHTLYKFNSCKTFSLNVLYFFKDFIYLREHSRKGKRRGKKNLKQSPH